jgi:F-type H+-transporting ATPase subunit delta
MSVIAKRYATALFELASEEQILESVLAETKFVRQVFEEHLEFYSLLQQYQLGVNERKQILFLVFENRISQMMLNILCLLIDKGRFSEVIQVCKEYAQLTNVSLGRKSGLVYSVELLSQQQLNDIEQAVSNKLKQKVVLENRLDHRMIAGVKVVIDDLVIDGSLKNKLYSLREELLKESR